MKLLKTNQLGLISLHAVLPLALAVAAIGGVGAYVLSKSGASSVSGVSGVYEPPVYAKISCSITIAPGSLPPTASRDTTYSVKITNNESYAISPSANWSAQSSYSGEGISGGYRQIGTIEPGKTKYLSHTVFTPEYSWDGKYKFITMTGTLWQENINMPWECYSFNWQIKPRPVAVAGDNDGNGTSDLFLYRPAGRQWYNFNATDYAAGNNKYVTYGSAGDISVPADYNGDGKADIAVFRPSNATWYLRNIGSFQYGKVGDIPVPADYNGDGKAELAIYRPSDGTWAIKGVATYVHCTAKGVVPVPADYNGDGKAEAACFYPVDRGWYIKGQAKVIYGSTGDVPVPADYNGDGKKDIAVFRPSNGTWYVRGGATTQYGFSKDIPIPADYNGDKKDDLAVFRTTTGQWFIMGKTTQQFGTNNDVPTQLPYAVKKYLYPTYGN